MDNKNNGWRQATAELRGVLVDVEYALEHGTNDIFDLLPTLEEVKRVLRRTAGNDFPALVMEDGDG